MRSIWPRCHIAARESGNKISTLLPSDVRHWLPILEDITMSPSYNAKLRAMTTHLEESGEWNCISMDATLKICLKLKGQASYRASSSVRNEAPFGDDVAWKRLLTVRGRSGAVLLLHPLQSEKSEDIVSALDEGFSHQQLGSILYVATDCPSAKMYNDLKRLCPRLKTLMLDPVHLAIVYEYGHWNKRTPGPKTLRRILKKTCAVDHSIDRTSWFTFYHGDMSRALDDAEVMCRDMIWSMSMPQRDADEILDVIECDKPFLHRLEFIMHIAAVCSRFAHEVKRKAAGPNKEIFKILWSACAPDRIEWLFNNIRARHTMPREHLHFLPSGTSSNEALHAEINSWSRSTNTLHRSTLALKLRYYRFIKLLAHHLATHHPLTHIVTETVLLGRALNTSIWTEEEWNSWCSQQNKPGRQTKALLPLAAAREEETSLVRGYVAKRPATKRTRSRKTPIRVTRKHTLRSSGVKGKKK